MFRHLFLTFIFLATNSMAFENQTFLKGGLSYSSATIEAQKGTEDDMKGLGFSTHFGHKWKYFELALSSYIFWGDIEGLSFQANQENIEGNGEFRHVSFGPVIKYHTQKPEFFKNWTPFIGLGPVWSLQTVKMQDYTSSGSSFHPDQKLTFESFGGMFVIGIEEQIKHKEAHPAFIEFIYSYKKSRKLAVVDATDPMEVNILSKDEGDQELSGHYFMLSFGVTIF